ncbi:MAG: hypothetical protein H0U27_11530, partial [Nitrosopumilus sp.]|nr:hypothetical protein [Nitrosopumilus sp.]
AVLSYKGVEKAKDGLKAKADEKGFTGESQIKNFCKDQACKVGGQIKNFFTQRLGEAVKTPENKLDLISMRHEINDIITKNYSIGGPKNASPLISENDSKFMDSLKDKKVLTPGEINRLVNIHTKVKERDELNNKFNDLVSYSQDGATLNKITGGIPKEAEAQLQGLIDKMTPNDTPAKPLTRDEVTQAMSIIKNIENKKDMTAKLNTIQAYFIDQSIDPENLKNFLGKMEHNNNHFKDAFISKNALGDVNDLHDYYLAVKPDANVSEENKYFGIKDVAGNQNNQKLQKVLYLDKEEREELLNKKEIDFDSSAINVVLNSMESNVGQFLMGEDNHEEIISEYNNSAYNDPNYIDQNRYNDLENKDLSNEERFAIYEKMFWEGINESTKGNEEFISKREKEMIKNENPGDMVQLQDLPSTIEARKEVKDLDCMNILKRSEGNIKAGDQSEFETLRKKFDSSGGFMDLNSTKALIELYNRQQTGYKYNTSSDI